MLSSPQEVGESDEPPCVLHVVQEAEQDPAKALYIQCKNRSQVIAVAVASALVDVAPAVAVAGAAVVAGLVNVVVALVDVVVLVDVASLAVAAVALLAAVAVICQLLLLLAAAAVAAAAVAAAAAGTLLHLHEAAGVVEELWSDALPVVRRQRGEDEGRQADHAEHEPVLRIFARQTGLPNGHMFDFCVFIHATCKKKKKKKKKKECQLLKGFFWASFFPPYTSSHFTVLAKIFCHLATLTLPAPPPPSSPATASLPCSPPPSGRRPAAATAAGPSRCRLFFFFLILKKASNQ